MICFNNWPKSSSLRQQCVHYFATRKFVSLVMVEEGAGCTGVEAEVYVDQNHNNGILTKLNEMRENGTLVDLWPVVDGVEFPSHVAVLASCSDYFLALCDSNLVPKSRKVDVTGITAKTFKALLDFMYTGVITLSPENVEDLLRGSSRLLLDKVKKKCCQYIMGLLNVDNCLGIFSISDELSCENLYNKALKYTQKHFSEICLHPDFIQLPYHLVNYLTASDSTSVTSEDSIYHAVMRWVLYKEDRQKVFTDLFMNIRLRFVSENTFTAEIVHCPFIQSSQACIERLIEAQKLRSDLARGARRLSFAAASGNKWLEPRLCMSDINVIVAIGGVHALLYNTEMSNWVHLSPIVTRHCPGMGVLDNDIIIVGGSREWKRHCAGIRYDPKRSQWLSMVSLNHRRSNLELVSLDGDLYAIGGYDGESPLRSVERFNPKHNKWEFVAPMNHPRDGLCVAADDDYLYAISGYDGNEYLNSVERYDPAKDQWEICGFAPISQYRENASCATIDGMIYIFGGYYDATFLVQCEVYDIASNKWSEIAPLSCARYQTGAAVLNRSIFVCGGWTEHSMASSLVECYNIDANEWVKVVSLPTPCTVRCASLMFPRKKLEEIMQSQEKIKKGEPK